LYAAVAETLEELVPGSALVPSRKPKPVSPGSPSRLPEQAPQTNRQPPTPARFASA
jgi:hypothetical protein